MKKILLTALGLCLLSHLLAQPEINGKELYNYIFPDFTEGTVKQKSGEINKALLNYNSLTQEMVFEQSGQKMALDKLENIDTVYINNKTFVPVGEVFYEMATKTPVALFIQHISKIIPPGNETGFGASQTSAITNMNDLKSSGGAYKLKLPDEYKLKSETLYWLKKNDKYVNVKNIKDIESMFPQRADSIRDFVKANKISFKNSEDVIKLIQFCN